MAHDPTKKRKVDTEHVEDGDAVTRLEAALQREQAENKRLRTMIMGLPRLIGFADALNHVPSAKQEFERFHVQTAWVDPTGRAKTVRDFNMYNVEQKTANIFCWLITDAERTAVIDEMVLAYERGQSTMRQSYRDLFAQYARHVEYACNRAHDPKRGKQVQRTREKWVEHLTRHFNDVVHRVYAGEACAGHA